MDNTQNKPKVEVFLADQPASPVATQPAPPPQAANPPPATTNPPQPVAENPMMSSNGPKITDFNDTSFVYRSAPWFFRVGFASIFLVNAIVAAIRPGDFTGLLNENIIAGAIGHADYLVKIAMLNDLLLGTLILIGIRKRPVYMWAGIWLLMVAGLKLMNLVF